MAQYAGGRMKTRTIDPESSYNAILLSFPQCVCEYENSFIVIVRHGIVQRYGNNDKCGRGRTGGNTE